MEGSPNREMCQFRLKIPHCTGRKFPGPPGHVFRQLLRRKNRSMAVVACARKLTVVPWHLLRSGELDRYAQPKCLEAKLSWLRVRFTGQCLSGGVLETRRAQHGMDRDEPLLAHGHS